MIVWNEATLAGREFDALPVGTILVTRSWSDYNLPWRVQRIIGQGEDEDIARFKNQQDALEFSRELK
jgi:hypothetical protein